MVVTSGAWPVMSTVVGSPTTVRMLTAVSLGLVTERIGRRLAICRRTVPLIGTIRAPPGWTAAGAAPGATGAPGGGGGTGGGPPGGWARDAAGRPPTARA